MTETTTTDTRLYFVRVSHRGEIIMAGHWLATDPAAARALGRAAFLRTAKPNSPHIDACMIVASISHANPSNALNKETA